MTTLATIDGSTRTIELGTLDAIELCNHIVLESGNARRSIPAWSTIATNTVDALDAYRLSQSDNEQIALDAREQLEQLMYETESAIYDLGYLAYWEDSIFYIETINDESDTN